MKHTKVYAVTMILFTRMAHSTQDYNELSSVLNQLGAPRTKKLKKKTSLGPEVDLIY